MVEIVEVSQTRGSDAAAHRSQQLMRNSERRRLNRDRKRFAAVALDKNLRLAADRLAEQKLAGQPPASGSSAPQETLTLAQQFEALATREAAAKKPPASAPAAGETVATKEAITA
jgi:hypothetical protein